MKEYIDAYKKYVQFDGRASLRQFWMYILIHFLIIIALGFTTDYFNFASPLFGIYILSGILPTISISVRRLHDSGKGGEWWFIRFVPLIGFIWFIALMLSEEDVLVNKYGPNPADK